MSLYLYYYAVRVPDSVKKAPKAYCIRRHLASYTGYGVSHYSDKPVSQALLNDSSDKPISHTLLKDSIDGKVSQALLWTRWTIVEGDDYLDSLSNRL